MKLLVCGSRIIDDYQVVYDAIEASPFEPETIVHGDADGVDSFADLYARRRNIDRDVHPIPDWVWETIGGSAGPMRNGYMVDDADAVVAVWNGESAGTKDTIQQAESEGLPVYKVTCQETRSGWKIAQEKLVEDDQACLGDFE